MRWTRRSRSRMQQSFSAVSDRSSPYVARATATELRGATTVLLISSCVDKIVVSSSSLHDRVAAVLEITAAKAAGLALTSLETRAASRAPREVIPGLERKLFGGRLRCGVRPLGVRPPRGFELVLLIHLPSPPSRPTGSASSAPRSALLRRRPARAPARTARQRGSSRAPPRDRDAPRAWRSPASLA